MSSPESDVVADHRRPLSRDRVLRSAVELADRQGLGALTMRGLAQELGVEAMSLYHHVANKEAVLDGTVEVIVGEINAAVARVDGPAAEEDWQGAMRARILAARAVLLRHPWAPRVLETRTTIDPGVLTYFDALLGIFVAGGFNFDLAHHAIHALGSRALGFTQELFEPDDQQAGGAVTEESLMQMADQLPNLVGMMTEVAHGAEGQLGWCDDQAEFEFGLDVILDGLERRRLQSGGQQSKA